MLKKDKRTRISMHSRDSMHLELAEGDYDKMMRFFAGVSRLSMEDGKIVETSIYNNPPKPVDDPMIGPYWPQLKNRCMVQTAFNFPKELSEHASPSIIISSVCGYHYSPENYKTETEKLERWGFKCFRSQRSENGKYWEQWVLSSLWSAENELKDIVKAKTDPFEVKDNLFRPSWEKPPKKRRMLKQENGEFTQLQKLRNAVEYLRRNVTFGTLDISTQRLAMVICD